MLYRATFLKKNRAFNPPLEYRIELVYDGSKTLKNREEAAQEAMDALHNLMPDSFDPQYPPCKAGEWDAPWLLKYPVKILTLMSRPVEECRTHDFSIVAVRENNTYLVCKQCEARRVSSSGMGYTPIDRAWLEGQTTTPA